MIPLAASLSVVLIISYIFNKAAQKFHLSAVIGLIFAGLLVSSTFLKGYLIVGHEEIFIKLSDLGLFTLMFLAGFEISWNMLLSEERDAIIITIFTVISSLFLGTLVFKVLGFSWEASLIMGICFGITAEATKARVLIQLKKIKTRIGALLMGTGIINDIIGVIFLIFITYFFTNNFSLNEIYILAGILISFFVGMIVHYNFNRLSRSIKRFEKILLIAIVPFFFVNMGLNFEFSSLIINPEILVITIIVAGLGQFLGVIFAKSIVMLSWKQVYLVGWGMNSKGAVELAVAYVALGVGILPPSLYSALVVSALVSTILFQVMIFKLVNSNPGIMK